MVFYGGGQTSNSSSKKISGILRAVNHFDTLQLPKPYADLAGEPVWDVSEEQVSKGFRKLSLCCHPDKSSDPEAPTAFEQLKKAKACLLNELDRDDYVRAAHHLELITNPNPDPSPTPTPDPDPSPDPEPSPGARLRQERRDAVGGQLGAGGGGAQQQAASLRHAKRGAAGAALTLTPQP